MGGPSAGVLLRTPLTTNQHQSLISLFQEVGVFTDEPGHVQIRTTRPIGGRFQDRRGSPVSFAIGAPEIETFEPERLIETFGFWPEQAIYVDSYGNAGMDHEVLGVLIATLAERYHGLVHFQGALFPALPPKRLHAERFWEASWEEVAAWSDALLKSLPGMAISLRYERWDDRHWAITVADSVFLRAWLKHPDFRMVK